MWDSGAIFSAAKEKHNHLGNIIFINLFCLGKMVWRFLYLAKMKICSLICSSKRRIWYHQVNVSEQLGEHVLQQAGEQWWREPLGKNLELLLWHCLSLISMDADIIRWLGVGSSFNVLHKNAFNEEKNKSSSFFFFFLKENSSRKNYTQGNLLREGCSKNIFSSQQNL